MKFKSIGGQITDFIDLELEGSIHYTEIIQQVHKNNPRLLYLPVAANSVLDIAKTVKHQDWSPQMLVTDGMLATVIEKYENELELVDGMLATDLYSSDMELSNYGKNYLKL